MITISIPLYVFILIFYVLPTVGNIIFFKSNICSLTFAKKFQEYFFIFAPIFNSFLFIGLSYGMIEHIKVKMHERYFLYKRNKRNRLEYERMRVYKVSHGIIRYNELDPYGEEDWDEN